MSPGNTESFKQHLNDPSRFTITFELVPSRGGASKEHDRTLELARRMAADGRIQAVSITENAGGHPALSPEVLGLEIKAMGLEVISHFSCKDKNRNQMESMLFGWDRAGLRSLLVITGDYPQPGYRGKPKPVFDLDSVQALDLISQMNRGAIAGTGGKEMRVPATSFFKAVAVSPFKLRRSELNLQYAKLRRKALAGADFIITQLGFDARKYHEVLLYVKESGLNLPILGNVFVPNLTVTKMMYRGEVPGCVITPGLYRRIMEEAATAPDKGKRARLTRAAGLLAVLQGMGFAGAHIGGPGLNFDDLDFLLRKAKELLPGWRRLVGEIAWWPADGAWLYARDEASGLNLPSLLPEPWRPVRGQPAYSFAHGVHRHFFEPGGRFFSMTKRACLALERGGHAGALATFEHCMKYLLFRCRNCGDCRLADLAYLCPQARCAKYLLNGPCGGSRDGWCEVFPNTRRCLYVLMHERLRAANIAEPLPPAVAPPRDWTKDNSSSWLNFFHDCQDQPDDT